MTTADWARGGMTGRPPEVRVLPFMRFPREQAILAYIEGLERIVDGTQKEVALNPAAARATPREQLAAVRLMLDLGIPQDEVAGALSDAQRRRSDSP